MLKWTVLATNKDNCKGEKMLEAMWGVEFGSNQDGGYGVVILETGRILGGDSSFIYR